MVDGSEKLYECSICARIGNRKDNMIIHVKTHLPSTPETIDSRNELIYDWKVFLKNINWLNISYRLFRYLCLCYNQLRWICLIRKTLFWFEWVTITDSFRTWWPDSGFPEPWQGDQGGGLPKGTQGQGQDHQACGGSLHGLLQAVPILWERAGLNNLSEEPNFRCPYKATEQNTVLNLLSNVFYVKNFIRPFINQ